MIRKRYSIEIKAPLLVFWLGAPWISLQFQEVERERDRDVKQRKREGKGRRKGLPKFAACMVHGERERRAWWHI